MSASIGAASSGSRPDLISDTYQRLRWMGFAEPEAANLTALKNGFGITAQPWTVRELAHLLFVRESRRVGRLSSGADDRVDGDDGTGVAPPVDRAPTPAVGDEAGPGVQPRHRDDSDGAVTLLTLFRSMAGPNATLDLLRRSAPRLDAAGDAYREDG